MANVGAEGRRKINVYKGNNSERWKAVKGFWDGSSKNNGKSGCGVVIEGVDWEKWITTSKIAVPLGTGTAMAAEVVGVCVLTGILVLVLQNSLSAKNFVSARRRHPQKSSV